MTLTNFTNGITSFGVPVYGSAVNGAQIPTNILWVNTVSGVNAGIGQSAQYPYQTLAYAMTQATANTNTYIYIMPGSTITVSDATSQPLNVAGVTIVGLGYGNRRPLFDFTTANTATIPVSAAGVAIQNCRFRASFLSIAAAFTVASGAYLTLSGNKFFDTSSVLNFLNIVQTTGAANTADGLTLIGNSWNGLGTTSVNSFVLSANDIDGAIWQNNTITLARTATAAILATITAGVLTNLIATGNIATSAQTADTGGALISVGGTTSTGIIASNFVNDLTTTTDLIAPVASGLRFQQNYKTGVLANSGFLVPAADS